MRSLARLVPRSRAAALALLAALAVSGWPSSARAGDPNLVWRTLETEHLRIHFYAGEGRLAERLAVVGEGAYRKLTPLLRHEPKGKVEVVLTDDTDDSNGSATAFPYPTVRLYATAPDDRSELNDYDDWLTALFTHEFTHIVHLDTVHGVARIVNFILGWGEWGRIYVPNQTQPRFIIEGLAVFEETEQTSAGRLRSTIYDMFLRSATLEGKFMRLDQITNDPIQFPRGGAAYLYGSAFLRFIARQYGDDALTRMSHEQAGTWIPGAINRTMRRVVGKTLSDLYPAFRRSMEERYGAQRARIATVGETPSRVLTRWREMAARPIFSRDGRRVIWSDSDGFSRPQLRSLVLDGPNPVDPHAPMPPLETVALLDGVGGSALSPDGRTLYFDAVDVWRTNYFFHDLYALDLASGTKRRLTDGLRAENPALSPDGTTLAFSVNDASTRSLATMRTDGSGYRVLVGNHDDLSQIYTPDWSPDGQRIAFSWWREGGWRDIWTVDVATGKTTRITADRALDLDPRFSPDGRYLYFSSDRTGVYDLYAYEFSTGRTFQVTNVLGGAFDVAISPDGTRAAYVGFQADGWRLEAIALDPSSWREAAPALADRPDPDVTKGEASIPSREYQPLRSMWPRWWQPSSYPDAFGQVYALRLGGSDSVGYHSWSIGVGWNPQRTGDVQVNTSYSYDRLWPSLSASFNRALNLRGGLFVDRIEQRYVEDDYSFDAAVGLPILRTLAMSSDLSFGYSLSYLRPTGEPRLPFDPNLISTRKPETGLFSTLGLSWSWSNVRRYTFSVSGEEGRALSLGVSASLRQLGSDYNVFSTTWRYQEWVPLRFHRLPLDWQNTVLWLSYQGGVSGGDLRRRGVYYIGGYAPQSDPLRSLIDFTRPGDASLRGYGFGAFHGSQFHVWNFEYRFPILWIERGYDTLPVYLRRLHGAVFADVGMAYDGTPTLDNVKVGAGAELRLETFLFWYLPTSFQLGYAHGFMKDGADQVYFLLNNPF